MLKSRVLSLTTTPCKPQKSSVDSSLDAVPVRPKANLRPGGSVAYWVRWLHTYLSLFAFTALLFFAVTGLTVNHPHWFYSGIQVNETDGKLTVDLAETVVGKASNTSQNTEPVTESDKDHIIAFLRRQHHVRGEVSEFRSDELECVVAFKGPGYSADATIDRQTGKYHLTQSRHGLVAVINDLHKGRDSGAAWSLVIDLSAVLMVVVRMPR